MTSGKGTAQGGQNMRKTTRLVALLLAMILLLQCTAAASHDTENTDNQADIPSLTLTEQSEPSGLDESEALPEASDPADPVAPPDSSDPEDPVSPPDVPDPEDPVPPPIELTLSADLEDGQTVHNPMQTLHVTAAEGETALDSEAITVKLNGEAVPAAEGAYSLNLLKGDNTVEITAVGSEETKVLTLTVRFEILIPEGWAHDALAFCVEYEILNGNASGDLLPTSHASRAQLAAMLVRLFAAEPTADLSGYTDVSENAWYYNEMARAVAMGIFEGSNGKLNPEQAITREQAFTVLARAFGVAAADLSALENFSDGQNVSSWAAAGVAGMLEAGYVNGTNAGTLNPKGMITRQELAQVLYNALDCITDDPEELTGSRMLYTGALEDLAGKHLTGDLILSCATEKEATVKDFVVDGRLVLHLHNAEDIIVEEVCEDISICTPAMVDLEAPVDTLLCLRDGAFVIGNAGKVIMLADATVSGGFGSVYCQGGNPTVSGISTVENLYLPDTMAGSTVHLYGEAQNVYAEAHKLTISENGRIENLYQYHLDLKNSCTVVNTVDRIDAGLHGVSVTPGSKPTAYYDKLELVLTGTITGVNTDKVYGVPDGVRKCTVSYSYNGKVIKTEKDFALTEGAALSCPVTAVMRYNIEETQNVVVTIRYGDETVTANLPFTSTGRYSDYHIAKNTVKTVHVIAVVNYSSSIYSSSSLSGYLTSVPAGTHVYFLKYVTDSGSIALVETKSGVRGYIFGYAIRISWQNYHNNDVVYSDGVKEAFVNEVNNYSSKTKYLIWCNLYTTTVNIFEGSQGNWKLIKSCECVIGAPNSPTRPGVYSIYSHAYYWSFDSGGKLDQSRCYYASLFDGGIAFHTRLYYTGTNTYVNSSLSAAISHGCVRCPDEIAKFIYNECPNGTTVVVY